MAFNNLPASLQSIIQEGYLEHEFHEALEPKLGFRKCADREPFLAEIGESITKTRTGLLPPQTDPMAPAANTDLTSGMPAQDWNVEQYILGVKQYGGSLNLNVATSRVAIGRKYLENTKKLGQQAASSVDGLARNALFDAYMGGNTAVTATLGAAASSIQVDDIRGFFRTIASVNGTGQLVAVSATNPVAVTVGLDTYVCIGAVADGPAPAWGGPNLMVFSQQGQNTSKSFKGISGVLTFATNVTVADGTAGNPVIAANAPVIARPDGAKTTATVGTLGKAATLTIQSLLGVKAELEANNIPAMEDGFYRCYADPVHLTGLYSDPVFQSFTRGQMDSEEYRQGAIAELLGLKIVRTTENPVQVTAAGTVRRAIVVGQGALIEGEFTGVGYGAVAETGVDTDMISVVDGIAHITRAPIDAAQQVITQTWVYQGGFVAPSDALTTPAVISTATNSMFKRAGIVESL